MRLVAALALLATLVGACSGAPPTGGSPTRTGPSTILGHWVLEAGDLEGRPILLVEGHRVTLSIEGTQVGGTSACNHYGGRITLAGTSLRFGEMGGTAMACADDVMASEAAYMAALVRVDSATLDGDRLVLSGPGTNLRFALLEAPPVADLVDTEWVLESLVDGAVVAAAAGERATLTLAADGSLTASTGCRRLTGQYRVVGDTFSPVQLRADGDCPPGLADQDGDVISVLERFTATVDGDRLALTGSGGIGLVYRTAQDD